MKRSDLGRSVVKPRAECGQRPGSSRSKAGEFRFEPARDLFERGWLRQTRIGQDAMWLRRPRKRVLRHNRLLPSVPWHLLQDSHLKCLARRHEGDNAISECIRRLMMSRTIVRKYAKGRTCGARPPLRLRGFVTSCETFRRSGHRAWHSRYLGGIVHGNESGKRRLWRSSRSERRSHIAFCQIRVWRSQPRSNKHAPRCVSGVDVIYCR